MYNRLLADHDPGIREQAFNVVRNLAENDVGVDMVIRELGSRTLLNHITDCLRSPDPAMENAIEQVRSSSGLGSSF